MSGKSRPSPPTRMGSWAMAELLFEEKARARRARRDEPHQNTTEDPTHRESAPSESSTPTASGSGASRTP